MKHKTDFLRGVNLGGWLVLERWITPSLFVGTDANDEYSLCRYFRESAAKKIGKHRASFITSDDFKWIAKQGLNAVRLPVGYWALGGEEPYYECRGYLDFAFKECAKNGLGLILDIHAVPGSQNGYYHSGRGGSAKWSRSRNRTATYKFLEKLVLEYKDRPALAGIELMNEPLLRISRKRLMSYYDKAYNLIRNFNDTPVIISDAYDAAHWQNCISSSKYKNVILDMHFYQVFSKKDKELSLEQHILKTKEWKSEIENIQKTVPVVIGEWSAALPPRTKGAENFNSAAGLYAKAQLEAFSEAAGWFYWTYKTEDRGPWNFRASVEKGLFKPLG